MGKSEYIPIVPAVEQSCRILLYLRDNTRFKMSLTEICQEMGIHKSKGYSILFTLGLFGFIEKDPHTKAYSLGPGLIGLSRRVLENLDFRKIAEPFLKNLAEETHSTALFGLINSGQVFIIAKYEGDHDIGLTIRLGHRFHITAGAHGKAIAAFLSEEERAILLKKEKKYFHGEPARLDFDRLHSEIEECRKMGFAKDMGKLSPGINALSTPVFAQNQKIVGCLILMGTFSENVSSQYGLSLVNTGRQISEKLGADPDAGYRKMGS